MNKIERRQRRKTKIRGRISGTSSKPRLSVYRSNSHVFAQLIDDEAKKTIVSASDVKIAKGSKSEKAKLVGQEIAKQAKTKKISSVVFDRAGYKYHGRIKNLADGAREEGLKF